MVPEHNEGSIGMSVAPSSFHPPQPTPLARRIRHSSPLRTGGLTGIHTRTSLPLQPTQILNKGKDINERSQQSLAKRPIASASWVRERRS